MAGEANQQHAAPDGPAAAGETRGRTTRALVLVTAGLLLASFVFPAGAGLSRNTVSFPGWWGGLDVSVAFLIAILVITIQALTSARVTRKAEEATYRVYRAATHLLLAVAVIIMWRGDAVNWAACATGFLWRTWLLLYSLPVWFAALQDRAGGGRGRF